MAKVRAYRGEVRARGQLTIPKEIREKGALYEGESVSIIPIGDSLLVTPHRLELDEARRELRRIMRESRVSLDDLIAGLENERQTLAGETYGDKET